MTFPLDRQSLGAPSYGPRKGTVGVVLHTTEGTDSSLAAGIATATWQATPNNTSGGSYHFILTDDGPILSVPVDLSAGSISGDHSPPNWAPDRYPELLADLGAAAYADPNAYLIAISVSGRTSLLQTYPRISRIVDDCARIIRWVENRWKINAAVTCHFEYQLDRSDPGQWFLDQVMARYAVVLAQEQQQVPSNTIGEAMTYAEIHLNVNPLRTVSFAPLKPVGVYSMLTPGNAESTFKPTIPVQMACDKLALVTQQPSTAPSGWYCHLVTGQLSGKWVALRDIVLSPDTVSATTDCTAQLNALKEKVKAALL